MCAQYENPQSQGNLKEPEKLSDARDRLGGSRDPQQKENADMSGENYSRNVMRRGQEKEEWQHPQRLLLRADGVTKGWTFSLGSPVDS